MGIGQDYSAQRKPILLDHQRNGKRLIPPLMQNINYQEISWRRQIIPELFWIALLNSRYGYPYGANLALVLPSSAKEATKEHSIETWFTSISSYGQLSIEEKKKTVELLRKKHVIDQYCTALLPLIYFYPSCPLRFLFDLEIETEIDTSELEEIKRVLESLFDRRSVEATFAQANVVYIGFTGGDLVVNQGLSLASFPEVQDYPTTEISRQVAASIRATVNVIFGNEEINHGKSWSTYFWNHGLELEKCKFD